MCQSSSSQRSCARRHASHSQRWSAPSRSGWPNARSARDSGSTDAVYPSVNRVTRASRSWSVATCGLSAVGGARRLGDLTLIWAGPEATGEHCRGDRLEVGLAGHRGVQGLEPLGRREQQRRRVAPASAGERDLRAQPLEPRALEVIERSELGGRQEVGRGGGSATSSLACAAASERSTRVAGSGVSSAARVRNAAAAASPPRACARSAERSSSPATASSGRSAARARCHARRSGSSCGSVASASARWTSRRSGAGAARYAAERTSGWRNRTRAAISTRPAACAGPAASGPMPSRSAARHSSGTSPSGSAAASSNNRRVSAENDLQLPHKALLDPAGQRHLPGQPKIPRHRDRLQPPRQLEQRERVPTGLAEDPVLHPPVERPGDRRVKQQPGVIGGQPVDHELRQPLELVLVAGLAQPRTPTPPVRPAGAAPRTRASAPTPGQATVHRRRCTPTAAPRRRRQAGSEPPTRPRNDPVGHPHSGRTPYSARHAAGPADARDRRASARTTRAAPRTRAPSQTQRPPPARPGIPPRPPTDAPSSAVLPIPASPRSTSTPL